MKAAMSGAVSMVVAVALVVVSARALASETDDRIQSSAENSYVFKTYLKGDAIKIESKDGVVALTGTVAEQPHKALAQETVASLPGVKSVDNRLEIKGTPATESADALVSARVKTALMMHRNLSAIKPDVQVKDGIVTLRGEATSPAQIDLTTEYIEDVEGVREVKNDMTVSKAAGKPAEKTMKEKVGETASAMGKKVSKTAGDVGETMGNVGGAIDDASITALVKVTLLYHRSTSALNTKVETNGGVVTLGGKARNASEKDVATKFVSDVYGVKTVVNNMTIEEAAPKTN
jgi:hyperosmotically inducible periplasmic protein